MCVCIQVMCACLFGEEGVEGGGGERNMLKLIQQHEFVPGSLIILIRAVSQ